MDRVTRSASICDCGIEEEAESDHKTVGDKTVSSRGCNRLFIVSVLLAALEHFKSSTHTRVFPAPLDVIAKWLKTAKSYCSAANDSTVYGGPAFSVHDPSTHWTDPQQFLTWWKNFVERRRKQESLLRDASYTGDDERRQQRAKFCRHILHLCSLIRRRHQDLQQLPDDSNDRSQEGKTEHSHHIRVQHIQFRGQQLLPAPTMEAVRRSAGLSIPVHSSSSGYVSYAAQEQQHADYLTPTVAAAAPMLRNIRPQPHATHHTVPNTVPLQQIRHSTELHAAIVPTVEFPPTQQPLPTQVHSPEPPAPSSPMTELFEADQRAHRSESPFFDIPPSNVPLLPPIISDDNVPQSSQPIHLVANITATERIQISRLQRSKSADTVAQAAPIKPSYDFPVRKRRRNRSSSSESNSSNEQQADGLQHGTQDQPTVASVQQLVETIFSGKDAVTERFDQLFQEFQQVTRFKQSQADLLKLLLTTQAERSQKHPRDDSDGRPLVTPTEYNIANRYASIDALLRAAGINALAVDKLEKINALCGNSVQTLWRFFCAQGGAVFEHTLVLRAEFTLPDAQLATQHLTQFASQLASVLSHDSNEITNPLPAKRIRIAAEVEPCVTASSSF